MKTSTLKLLLSIVSFMLAHVVFGQEIFEKIPDDKIENTKIELASNIANAYFESANGGNY